MLTVEIQQQKALSYEIRKEPLQHQVNGVVESQAREAYNNKV